MMGVVSVLAMAVCSWLAGYLVGRDARRPPPPPPAEEAHEIVVRWDWTYRGRVACVTEATCTVRVPAGTPGLPLVRPYGLAMRTWN